MRITPFLLAGALALGMGATASAGPKGMGGGMGHGMGHAMGGGMGHGFGHGMGRGGPWATGSVRPGASYYAPGQVKKRMGVRSARDFAPGRAVAPYSTPPGHRFR